MKVYLLQNGKKVSKKKTTVKRGEKSPIFNEAMIFSVPSTVLSVGLVFTHQNWVKATEINRVDSYLLAPLGTFG